MFKSLFTFSNTNHVHKSIIIVSFLVSVALIFMKEFFIGLISLFGEGSERFFNLLINPTSKVIPLSIAVFIISYAINVIINLSQGD